MSIAGYMAHLQKGRIEGKSVFWYCVRSMAPLIAVGIGILVLIIGFTIYRIGLEILDEGDYFFYAVGFFLLLFTVCGLALYFLVPRPPRTADLSTIAPARIVDGLSEFADRSYRSSGGSSVYSGR